MDNQVHPMEDVVDEVLDEPDSGDEESDIDDSKVKSELTAADKEFDIILGKATTSPLVKGSNPTTEVMAEKGEQFAEKSLNTKSKGSRRKNNTNSKELVLECDANLASGSMTKKTTTGVDRVKEGLATAVGSRRKSTRIVKDHVTSVTAKRPVNKSQDRIPPLVNVQTVGSKKNPKENVDEDEEDVEDEEDIEEIGKIVEFI